MSAVVDWFRDQTHRAYLYRVAGVLNVALIGAGAYAEGQSQVVLLLIGTVLGVPTASLAAANTSTKREP